MALLMMMSEDDGFECTILSEKRIKRQAEPCAGVTCPTGASCIAGTNGSYECSCMEGFTGDGSTCTDMNECEEGSHNCSFEATCINLLGTYTCMCNVGFSGDGLAVMTSMNVMTTSIHVLRKPLASTLTVPTLVLVTQDFLGMDLTVLI